MAYSHYERLSGVDAMFLRIEEPNVHMHVGAVAVFDAEPLRTGEGKLNFERIRDPVNSALAHSPRFQQKLASVPVLNHPIWLDDSRFNLDYHVRHTSLPRPGSIRTKGERGSPGNRVAMLLADLPLSEKDPRERLDRVIETTRNLKRSRQRAGVEIIEDLSNRVMTSIFLYFARLASRQRAFNMVVTNVPGPPCPVYLLGSRMLEIYPLVPLAMTQGLGIALVSYDGGLHWGFNADWDALPDLHDLVKAMGDEIQELCALAASDSAPEAAAKA